MARAVHFRIDTNHTGGIAQPTACGAIEFNTLDTDAVTCPKCRSTELYTLTAHRHREVVDALSSPKEDHPCLTPRSATSPRGT